MRKLLHITCLYTVLGCCFQSCCNDQKHKVNPFPANFANVLPKYPASKLLFYKNSQGGTDTLISNGQSRSLSQEYCEYCGLESNKCNRVFARDESSSWSGNYRYKGTDNRMGIYISNNPGCDQFILFKMNIPKSANKYFYLNNAFGINKCKYNEQLNNMTSNALLNYSSPYFTYPVVYPIKMNDDNGNIDSLYYAPSYGMVRIVKKDGTSFELMNPSF